MVLRARLFDLAPCVFRSCGSAASLSHAAAVAARDAFMSWLPVSGAIIWGVHPIANDRTDLPYCPLEVWQIRQAKNNDKKNYNKTTMKNNYMTQTVLLISSAALASMAFAQNTAAEKPKIEIKDNEKAPAGSLTTIISDSTTFATLTKALRATELDVTLGAKGEFTLFAPTDEAFGKLPAGVLTKLMLPENKEKLRSLLLYHVVAGRMLLADLKDGEVKSMNGEKVKLDVKADAVMIDESKVYSTDVLANNGVMHTIGKVLIPKSLDGFEGLKN
jgi:uncharacterized surface protein with fasciclin (FAS1) repeats